MVKVNLNHESAKPIHTRTCVYDLHYHLVWVTKYRNKAFNDKIQKALKSELLKIAKENKITIEAMEVMPNHIHMLISAKPKLSITVIVKKFKGITGKWLFKTFPREMDKYFWHQHIWSHSYYVGSIGNTTKKIVKHYIRTQKERPYR